MAGYQPRIFTAEEANKALPLVSAIVRDSMEKWKRLETAKRSLRKTSARLPVGGLSRKDVDEQNRLKQDIRDLERAIEEHRGELEELGAYLKDAEKGLVDFPAFMGTELVYLCWSPGDAKVAHYHGVREAFVARRPIPATRVENEAAS